MRLHYDAKATLIENKRGERAASGNAMLKNRGGRRLRYETRTHRVWACEALERREMLAVIPAAHVVHISVDGLGGIWLRELLDNQASLPAFRRLQSEGSWTLDARTDYTHTITLPNHTSMLTGRPVLAPAGQDATVPHDWVDNTDPPPDVTLHSNQKAVDYIHSVFDVAHDHGLTTTLLATKTKFSLFDISYDEAHGATDTEVAGGDNGRDKIDVFRVYDTSAALVDEFVQQDAWRRSGYSFLHFAEPDYAGHQYGWGSARWNTVVQEMDTLIGRVLQTISSDDQMRDRTVVLVTADHGGSGRGHEESDVDTNYEIPFFAWGPGFEANTDLYTFASDRTRNPLDDRPDYNASLQPIRNGDSGNLALHMLGLPLIPGSSIASLVPLADEPDDDPTDPPDDNPGEDPEDDPDDPPDEDPEEPPAEEPRFDFGDAPAPYPTLAAKQGASHRIEAGFFLGSRVDEEVDGVPSAGSRGDDLAQTADEEGVAVVGQLRRGTLGSLRVTASQPGYLQAWIDWNRDGDWSDTGEQIARDVRLQQGDNRVSLTVPANISAGKIQSRFRFSRQTHLQPTGPADSGEVEDYEFTVEAPAGGQLAAQEDSFRFVAGAASYTLSVLQNDIGSSLRIQSTTKGNRGGLTSVSNARNTVIYSPAAQFVGTETFSYTITDGAGQSTQGRVTVTLTAPPAPVRREDVDRNGTVSPMDALLVINEMNERGARATDDPDAPVENRLDVDQDGFLSPADALRVINYLNDRDGLGTSRAAQGVSADLAFALLARDQFLLRTRVS